jgi:CheY-like chemotaxis protein
MTPAKSILYVEDDAVTATAYKWLLQRAGYAVKVAGDGVEALKCLNQSLPDIMLLDLVLPRLNGEDVLKFIYATPRFNQVPIIVLSTNSIVDMTNEPLLEKAGRQLLKHDCSIKKLLDTIEETLADAETIRQKRNGLGRQTDGKSPANTSLLNPGAPASDGNGVEESQAEPQVVCAWTNRIKVDDVWMTMTEFLSQRLNVPVTHGISPEAMQAFLKGAK